LGFNLGFPPKDWWFGSTVEPEDVKLRETQFANYFTKIANNTDLLTNPKLTQMLTQEKHFQQFLLDFAKEKKSTLNYQQELTFYHCSMNYYRAMTFYDKGPTLLFDKRMQLEFDANWGSADCDILESESQWRYFRAERASFWDFEKDFHFSFSTVDGNLGQGRILYLIQREKFFLEPNQVHIFTVPQNNNQQKVNLKNKICHVIKKTNMLEPNTYHVIIQNNKLPLIEIKGDFPDISIHQMTHRGVVKCLSCSKSFLSNLTCIIEPQFDVAFYLTLLLVIYKLSIRKKNGNGFD